jgi:hypothetical protein
VLSPRVIPVAPLAEFEVLADTFSFTPELPKKETPLTARVIKVLEAEDSVTVRLNRILQLPSWIWYGMKFEILTEDRLPPPEINVTVGAIPPLYVVPCTYLFIPSLVASASDKLVGIVAIETTDGVNAELIWCAP